MGIFGSLEAEAYDRVYSDKELISRIAGYFRPQRKPLAACTI